MSKSAWGEWVGQVEVLVVRPWTVFLLVSDYSQTSGFVVVVVVMVDAMCGRDPIE